MGRLEDFVVISLSVKFLSSNSLFIRIYSIGRIQEDTLRKENTVHGKILEGEKIGEFGEL